ncbi:unnamed protein product, partial [marine sediment metagenome]
PIHFPFIGGVDTKTAEKHVQPTRLLELENAVFDDVGQVKKRDGYTQLGQYDVTEAGESDIEEVVGAAQDLEEIRYCAANNVTGINRLLAVAKIESDTGQSLADGWRALSRIGKDGTWHEAGAHNPMTHTVRDISRSTTAHACDWAITTNYIVAAYVWYDIPIVSAASYNLVVEILDRDTYTPIAKFTRAGVFSVRLVANPDGSSVEILADQASTNRLDKAVWTEAAPTTTLSWVTNYITDFAAGAIGYFDSVATTVSGTHYINTAY